MPIVGNFSCQSPLRGFYEAFFPHKTPSVGSGRGLSGKSPPDTRTIVHSLSNVKCRGVVWFFPLRRWRRTLYSTTPYHPASAAQRFHAAVSSSTPSRGARQLSAVK